MGKFQKSAQSDWEVMEWGTQTAISSPLGTNSKELMIFDVIIYPGKGHSFHRHPRQEEVIYVLEGEVEQWIKGDKQILKSGDSAFIKEKEVHASFNQTKSNARILAILSPCIGEAGYEIEVVDLKI